MFRALAILVFAGLCGCDNPSDPSKTTTSNLQQAIPSGLVDTDSPSGENAMYHAARIVSFGDRSPGSAGYRNQLEYLKEQLQSHGWTCLEQTFEVDAPTGRVSFTNLCARLGESASFDVSPKLVLGCHIDTKTGIEGFVGANDGASGAAVILEVARILAREGNTASIELVFFDGEESFGRHITDTDGLFGSNHYVNQLTAPLPSWMINLDMVGRQGMKIRIPPDTPQSLYTVYRQAVAALNLSSSRWGVSAHGVIDDHIPFMKKGIPALNIIDDFQDGNWWHSSRDNLDILSARSLKESSDVALFIIRSLTRS